MDELYDHEKRIGIPDGHKLVESKPSEWRQGKGLDTDTYWYNEVNAAGKVVSQYVVRDSTSMYPPFNRSITFQKVGGAE